MFRVTLWPLLLLVILILRQSAAVSDQCSQLQEEISRLERENVRLTEGKHNYERLAGNCDEDLRLKKLISQATSEKLNKTEAVNIDLKKQLEVKEEVLKSINEKQTELQTTIDNLTKTVESTNHQLFEKQTQLQTNIDGLKKRVELLNKPYELQNLFEKQTQLQTTIDGIKKSVESLNDMSQFLCGLSRNVCGPLLEAAKSGDVDRAKSFVKCDANDKCTAEFFPSDTPLIAAAWNGHLKVVRVLLEGGANVNRANADRNTALNAAAWKGDLDVCRLLLDWGANMHVLDKWQYTPLHNAAWLGHLSVVKLLVERGADVSVKNGRGQTARDMALNEGKKYVADWLDSVRRG